MELDKRQVRAGFERAAPSYDSHAVLQREIADRLLERLDLIKPVPKLILDAGCGTGYCGRMLRKRYRRSRVVGVDIARQMLQRAHAGWFHRNSFLCANIEALPLAGGVVDMVVSNLTLQWCRPDLVFNEFRRVMRPGALLMFTTFGPDTLKELREAWRTIDLYPHVHSFIDMHDLGDALIRAGFTDPVMDCENVTLTYADVIDVLRDLKSLGAHNVAMGRQRGLTGKQRFARFRAAYEKMGNEGRIPASYEVIYGHAWVAEDAMPVEGLPAGAVPLRRMHRVRR